MISIDVVGIPAPGGSKKGFIVRGRVVMAPDCKRTKPWMSLVAETARRQYNGPLLDGPICMSYEFVFPRPKSHFRTGKLSHILRDDAPKWHTSKPDLTKIIRSTEDALSGVVWKDDCRVCKRTDDTKRYANPGEQPGVHMLISEL